MPCCLILACGNTLRQDDGVGPWLAEWAAKRFKGSPEVQVFARQQWTPEISQDIAGAKSVLFVDCSIEALPGSIHIQPVEPSSNPASALATHHVGAPELLSMAKELFNSLPSTALLMTIGAGSIELGEEFSAAVKAALPNACEQLEKTVLNLIATNGVC